MTSHGDNFEADLVEAAIEVQKVAHERTSSCSVASRHRAKEPVVNGLLEVCDQGRNEPMQGRGEADMGCPDVEAIFGQS